MFSGGAGNVNLLYGFNGGFLQIAQSWTADFSSITVPITLPGTVNTSTIQIEINALATSGGPVTATVTACVLNIQVLTTDTIGVTQFGFTVLSSSAIGGIVVSVRGFAPSATIYGQLLKAGNPVGNIYSVELPTTNNFVTLGSATDTWGEMWAYTDVDATGFGVMLGPSSQVRKPCRLDYCKITIYGSSAKTNFLGLMSADLNSTDLTTLALDTMGLVWAEDVTNAPNVLARAGLIPAVVPGSYMKGVDADGIAYMAYSDLTQGTSQPMQYNGEWCDRITQVGPGQAPVFTPQQATGDTFGISTITQPVPGPFGGGMCSRLVCTLWAGIAVGWQRHHDLLFRLNYSARRYRTGQCVQFRQSGVRLPANDGRGGLLSTPIVAQVTSVGLGVPPGQARAFYYFTYQATAVGYAFSTGGGGYEVQYQQSLATLTTTVPVPGLTVGNQIVVSGSSPSAWNSTWTITQLLNSGSVSITQTSVTANVATYNYTLISGVAPSAGQLITITNTLNANGLLNGANLVIATATGGSSGSFTINVSLPNASVVAETGQGVTAGTIFAFDPGAVDVDTTTDPIFGNGTGGTLTFSANTATFITPGVKQGSCFWVTRNGAVTQPANPVTFTIPSNTSAIAATLIPVGPPNIAYVGIAFTESGQNEVPGANFYTYDTAVTFTVNGTQYTASALIVPNGTTSATFSFPDSVLLASDEIDVQGNNYFNLREIGSCTWFRQYANRMQYGLSQTKIDNFVNLSFDGGYLQQPTLSRLVGQLFLSPISPLVWSSLQISGTPSKFSIREGQP